jgi:hypothetical protein
MDAAKLDAAVAKAARAADEPNKFEWRDGDIKYLTEDELAEFLAKRKAAEEARAREAKLEAAKDQLKGLR